MRQEPRGPRAFAMRANDRRFRRFGDHPVLAHNHQSTTATQFAMTAVGRSATVESESERFER